MEKYNIKLIGTTHLTPREEIIEIIEKEKPDIIGVEFCETRLNTMVINPIQQEVEDNSLLGTISRKIKEKAQKENLNYGSDMITASKYALEYKIPLLLVDKDIRDIQYLMSKIPESEVKGFMNELAEFEKKDMQEEMKNVDADKVINELKTNYPISYVFLIELRDLFIANKIMSCHLNNPKKKLIVFIGKGHINGINKLLGVTKNEDT